MKKKPTRQQTKFAIDLFKTNDSKPEPETTNKDKKNDTTDSVR